MSLLKKLFLTLFFYFLISNSWSNDLIPDGKYAVIIASRPSLSEAEEYIATLPNTQYVNVYKSQNGWYAISLGFLNDDELYVFDKLKEHNRIPQDSFCTRGKKFIREVSFRKPDRIITTSNSDNSQSSQKGCDLNKEIVACYAVVVGPKICTQLITDENPQLADSFGSRYALGVACSQGVTSAFAKSNLPETMAMALVDEGLETGCSMIEKDDIFSKILGGAFCVGNLASWASKIDAANYCVSQAKRHCK